MRKMCSILWISFLWFTKNSTRGEWRFWFYTPHIFLKDTGIKGEYSVHIRTYFKRTQNAGIDKMQNVKTLPKFYWYLMKNILKVSLNYKWITDIKIEVKSQCFALDISSPRGWVHSAKQSPTTPTTSRPVFIMQITSMYLST